MRRLRLPFVVLGLCAALLPAACSPNPVYRLRHEGRLRTYAVHVPADANAKNPLPIVLVLHGGGGSGARIARHTGFDAVADREGFLVVYPDGVRGHWNDGRGSQDYAHRVNVDDVGFLEALIDTVAEQFNGDANRVFMTGPSNGGMMTYRFACERPERLAGVAPVIACVPEPIAGACAGETALPALIINGTEDPLVPFGGGGVQVGNRESGRVISAPDSAALLAQRNGCGETPAETVLPDIDPDDGTTVRLYHYGNCAENAEVIFYVIEGGGHTWPGGRQYGPEPLVGRVSRELNATETIWTFFAEHL